MQPTAAVPPKSALPPKYVIGSLGALGETIGSGLRWVPALRTAGVLVAGYTVVAAVLGALGLFLTKVLLLGSVGRWDRTATSWLAEHRVGWLDQTSGLLSLSADTLGAIGLATLVVVVLACRRRWWQVAVLVIALALELSVFLLVNFVVDRPRPDVAKLGSTPSTSSFPSGHSAATVVLYGCVAVFVWLGSNRRFLRVIALVAAVMLPAAVGSSRVYRGMHHPLDVLFGFGMGAAVVAVSIIAVSAGFGVPWRTADESQASDDPAPTPPQQTDLDTVLAIGPR